MSEPTPKTTPIKVPELQRITSEYVEAEDRMRLTGDTEQGEAQLLWISQRLMIRLVTHLLKWLENQGVANLASAPENEQAKEMVQGFAQQTAEATLTPEPPVQSKADSKSWLVHEIDINTFPEAVQLLFKDSTRDQASLILQTEHLRQWLSIIHGQWVKAEWPMSIWPQWMHESLTTGPAQSETSIH
mgnify:CR=1 FL=1